MPYGPLQYKLPVGSTSRPFRRGLPLLNADGPRGETVGIVDADTNGTMSRNEAMYGAAPAETNHGSMVMSRQRPPVNI